MKVLVQNPVTLAYFQSADSWTADPEEAFAFEDSHSAVQFCLDHGMSEMQVVLKFGEEQYDVQLPVGTAASAPIATHAEMAL